MNWDRLVTFLSVCVAAGSAYLAYSAQLTVSETARTAQEKATRFQELSQLRREVIIALHENDKCYPIGGFEGKTTDCEGTRQKSGKPALSNEAMVSKIYRMALLSKPLLSKETLVAIFGKEMTGLDSSTGDREIDIAYDYDDSDLVWYASKVVAALDHEIDVASSKGDR